MFQMHTRQSNSTSIFTEYRVMQIFPNCAYLIQCQFNNTLIYLFIISTIEIFLHIHLEIKQVLLFVQGSPQFANLIPPAESVLCTSTLITLYPRRCVINDVHVQTVQGCEKIVCNFCIPSVSNLFAFSFTSISRRAVFKS